ncbi:MAG TPA: XrtA/PEP-CTERM system-associated ATPase [Acetobacteraceae bacterium]|nr:XrtA/PEP-CTERM system-associated ATPase [Acetobacteraceae bacterium]
MFDTFYNFTGPPFQLTPDSRFFFGSTGHSRAISHLVYGLAQEEGFVVITGEVGAGKTTLVEQLWAQLDRASYVMGRVVTTLVSGDDLLRLALASLGVEDTAGDKAAMLRRFEQAVRAHRAAGRRCLLVVDEAQNLSHDALEELRMLSNVTIDARASLQTILLGQPQLRAVLASPELEQLRQRVLASYHLGPLSEAETQAYVEHRLRTVGWAGAPRWADGAFAALFRHTGGLPRRINTLCARVLLYGALEEAHVITGAMVEATAAELARDLSTGLPAHLPARGVVTHEAADGVAGRIAMLEAGLSRQGRTLRRLLDLIGAYAETIP